MEGGRKLIVCEVSWVSRFMKLLVESIEAIGVSDKCFQNLRLITSVKLHPEEAADTAPMLGDK
jgi:hypothetical protein